MSDADHTPPPPAAAGKALPPLRARRWPRRLLIAVLALVALLAGAVWLLGRESTLQQLVQRLANASGGQIAVSGVSGSLYSRMHVTRLVYRSPDSVITADNIDINWSPLQYFSEGISISELHVASLLVQSIGPSKPPVLPATLAAPFRLSLADARLDKLTLASKDGTNIISNVRFQLNGDRASWHIGQASALTAVGLLKADVTLGAERPFPIQGKASLTQTVVTATATAGQQPPAHLDLQAGGSLALLDLKAQGTAGPAKGNAVLALAPFDPVMLRSVEIQGSGIDPSSYAEGGPQAQLGLRLSAKVGAGQQLSGELNLHNEGKSGPLDQQLLPLRAITAKLDGTLTASRIDAVLIDLGAAGRFHGGGQIARSAPDAGIASASFKLHTDGIDLRGLYASMNKSAIAGDIELSTRDKRHTLGAALGQTGLKLELQATLADALLQLKQARLTAKQGSISATGQLSLKDEHAFKASASASRFDPSAFGAYPVADINADLKASGKLAPQWKLAADFALRPSKLLNQPLGGSGKLQADAQHISGVEALITLGENKAELRGSFGLAGEQRGEQLNWKVDAPKLSAASSSLLGSASASGVISGSMAAPRSSINVDARGLGLAAAKHPTPEAALHAAGDIWLSGAGKARAP
ncbi:hypothetical protein HSX11_29740, partial [Oxalobacteraceae bacterium]|nr:hypothetical protein [Oxalobacteraceae bacterium]